MSHVSVLRAAWIARFFVTVGVLLAVAFLLTTVPWTVALALLAVVGIGAGLWTLGAIASLPADEEGR
jgi:Kef-type K+ transport system membrane component KefB